MKNNILLKKIVIKQVGLLGEENIIYESREVETLTQENIFISISPFLTKKITVSMLLEIEEEKILITKDFFPVFEYGTYELWKFFFPIMWEMIQKVPIIRMG